MNDIYQSKMGIYVEETLYMQFYMTADDLIDFQRNVIREKISVPGQTENYLQESDGVRKGLN